MIKDSQHVLSNQSTPETRRVPENGLMPRVTDTLITDDSGSDPEYHAEALANAVVDNEAGAVPEDRGGIVPLKRKS